MVREGCWWQGNGGGNCGKDGESESGGCGEEGGGGEYVRNGLLFRCR